MSKHEQVLNSLFQMHKTRNIISMTILLDPIPNNLECLIYAILTKVMEDGWNIFTKVVPKTTPVRGPATLRNRKYFLDFPYMWNIKIITRFQVKTDIPSKQKQILIPGASWPEVLQEWWIPLEKGAMKTTKGKTSCG